MMHPYNEVLNLDTARTTENYRDFDNKIVTEQARYNLKNTISNFSDFRLDPNYQRGNVWDINKRSRLIESFMLNIPVPPVFLYETSYSKYEVVDGRQRISTLIDFYKNEFQLRNLEIFSEIEGCNYKELPEEFKAKLDRRFLSAIILLNESANSENRELELKQFIFERLNTGGELLEPQEIRSALYSDTDFNKLLKELSGNESFKRLFKMTDNECKRKLNEEMILRFFAYKSALHLDLSLGTKEILNKYMSISKNFDDEIICSLRRLFINTIQFVENTFGDSAFVRSKKTEKMLYDAIMIACAICVENSIEVKLNPEILVSRKEELLKSHSDKFNGRNTSLRNVKERVGIFLNEIMCV